MSKRDRLFLLRPGFVDQAMPGRNFFCKDCIAVHGLLQAFPECAGNLDIVYVDHPRPRAEVVAEIGEANQWLPVLVFGDDAPVELAGGEYHGTRFVTDLNDIFHALHIRHHFPEVHP